MNKKYTIWIVVGVLALASLIWLLISTNANPDGNPGNPATNLAVNGQGNGINPPPSTAPYSPAYLQSLNIVPATNFSGQYQFTDTNGNVTYGDAQTLVKLATSFGQ